MSAIPHPHRAAGHPPPSTSEEAPESVWDQRHQQELAGEVQSGRRTTMVSHKEYQKKESTLDVSVCQTMTKFGWLWGIKVAFGLSFGTVWREILVVELKKPLNF